MSKYEDFLCPKCNKETLHRLRNKYGIGDKGKGYLKYQAKHCLTCNHYHGYKRPEKKERMISLRKDEN